MKGKAKPSKRRFAGFTLLCGPDRINYVGPLGDPESESNYAFYAFLFLSGSFKASFADSPKNKKFPQSGNN
jgi:hypothetical protein